MARHDIEYILSKVQTFLAANLNTQLSALDAEKNDGITLVPVPSGSYHLQTLEDRVDMSEVLVLYGTADDAPAEQAGSAVATVHHINLWIILTDNGNDANIVKRLFRYQRAMIDVFRLSWATALPGQKLKIKAFPPGDPFKDLETSWTARAVGVQLQVTIV